MYYFLKGAIRVKDAVYRYNKLLLSVKHIYFYLAVSISDQVFFYPQILHLLYITNSDAFKIFLWGMFWFQQILPQTMVQLFDYCFM